MELRMEFGEKLEDLRPAIATLERAIDELLSCDLLRDVLEVALVAGNIINGVSGLAEIKFDIWCHVVHQSILVVLKLLLRRNGSLEE